jgi:hypothetical protein
VPDSTIGVRAANELSRVSSDLTLVSMNSGLSQILRNKGYPDLRNCIYYFSGHMSSSNEGSPSLGNYNDTVQQCSSLGVNAVFEGNLLQCATDIHWYVFLSVFKSSKSPFFILNTGAKNSAMFNLLCCRSISGTAGMPKQIPTLKKPVSKLNLVLTKWCIKGILQYFLHYFEKI